MSRLRPLKGAWESENYAPCCAQNVGGWMGAQGKEHEMMSGGGVRGFVAGGGGGLSFKTVSGACDACRKRQSPKLLCAI